MQFEPPVVITSPYGKLDQHLDKSGLQAFPLTDSLLQASSAHCPGSLDLGQERAAVYCLTGSLL